jgi:hypothetical protein
LEASEERDSLASEEPASKSEKPPPRASPVADTVVEREACYREAEFWRRVTPPQRHPRGQRVEERRRGLVDVEDESLKLKIQPVEMATA